MSQLTRYKNHSVFVDGKNYDIVQTNHTLAVGFANQDEDPLVCAKRLIDAEFTTFALLEIRKLQPTKR